MRDWKWWISGFCKQHITAFLVLTHNYMSWFELQVLQYVQQLAIHPLSSVIWSLPLINPSPFRLGIYQEQHSSDLGVRSCICWIHLVFVVYHTHTHTHTHTHAHAHAHTHLVRVQKWSSQTNLVEQIWSSQTNFGSQKWSSLENRYILLLAASHIYGICNVQTDRKSKMNFYGSLRLSFK